LKREEAGFGSDTKMPTNPIIQEAKRLAVDHCVVELTGEQRRAFALDPDEVDEKRKAFTQNFCLILFDRLSIDYFVIPFQVLANTLVDEALANAQDFKSQSGWEGTIVENKTMRFQSGKTAEIGSYHNNQKLLNWLAGGHDVFSFNDIGIEERAGGWPTYVFPDWNKDAFIDLFEPRRAILEYAKGRPGQTKFRTDLCVRYGSGCMATRCEIEELVEAAHIVPYRVNADHHPANGLLLRADIHTLFDAHLLGIAPDTLEISIHPLADRDGYGDLNGRKLRLRSELRPSTDALTLRWNWFTRTLQIPRTR
jgi:HNH endonuclease